MFALVITLFVLLLWHLEARGGWFQRTIPSTGMVLFNLGYTGESWLKSPTQTSR